MKNKFVRPFPGFEEHYDLWIDGRVWSKTNKRFIQVHFDGDDLRPWVKLGYDRENMKHYLDEAILKAFGYTMPGVGFRFVSVDSYVAIEDVLKKLGV